jgi:hypothetical protein
VGHLDVWLVGVRINNVFELLSKCPPKGIDVLGLRIDARLTKSITPTPERTATMTPLIVENVFGGQSAKMIPIGSMGALYPCLSQST